MQFPARGHPTRPSANPIQQCPPSLPPLDLHPRVNSANPPPTHDPLLKDPPPPPLNPHAARGRRVEPLLVAPAPPLPLAHLRHPIHRVYVRRHHDVIPLPGAELEELVVPEPEHVGAPVCVVLAAGLRRGRVGDVVHDGGAVVRADADVAHADGDRAAQPLAVLEQAGEGVDLGRQRGYVRPPPVAQLAPDAVAGRPHVARDLAEAAEGRGNGGGVGGGGVRIRGLGDALGVNGEEGGVAAGVDAGRPRFLGRAGVELGQWEEAGGVEEGGVLGSLADAELAAGVVAPGEDAADAVECDAVVVARGDLRDVEAVEGGDFLGGVVGLVCGAGEPGQARDAELATGGEGEGAGGGGEDAAGGREEKGVLETGGYGCDAFVPVE